MSSSGDTNADDHQGSSTFDDINGDEAPIQLQGFTDPSTPSALLNPDHRESSFLGTLPDTDENKLICEESLPAELFQEGGIEGEHDAAGSTQQASGGDEDSTVLVHEEDRLKPGGENSMEGSDQFSETCGGDIPLSSQHNDQGGSRISDIPENLSPAVEDQFEPEIRSPPPELLAAARTRGSGLILNMLLPTPSDRAKYTILLKNNEVKLKRKSAPRSAGKEPAQSSGNRYCYKTDCLNRSCPCFAADVRCDGSCSCSIGTCRNRSEYGVLFPEKKNILKPQTPLTIGPRATQSVANAPSNAELTSIMPPPSTSTAPVSSASPVDQTPDMNKSVISASPIDQTPDMNKSVISQDSSAASQGGNSPKPKPQDSKDPKKPHDDNSTKQ